MSLRENLNDFMASVGSLASHAPDRYPKGSYRSFQTDLEFLLSDWSAIVEKLGNKNDIVAEIDADISKMVKCFEVGDVELGRTILWSIYNDKERRIKKVIK